LELTFVATAYLRPGVSLDVIQVLRFATSTRNN